ncbi:hypothetical protein B0H16DRAFT_1882064 [Mycena metata]|uniref:F-box domain-containing protein n=1 Tax=Mycena metata TaxID=1033252 RepID=A0AAD7JNZ6_9AGAR|nr:hypothetical protein B0H16DRAFT_1882064 [Mycena metata]
MSPHLPDEIVSEILSPALKVSEEKFLDNESEVSPFASPSVSSSAALVVCKAWLRVATPLLYHVVVIRSTAQARALQRTLGSNPDLGKFIRMLRVEGGFGPAMGHVLKHTPNITDIFLSLQIHAADSTTGLVLGLAHINPTRLIIFDYASRHIGQVKKNKHVRDLMQALEDCAPRWLNLTAVNFPYYYPVSGGDREDLVTAICGYATVKKVSFPRLRISDVPFLTDIAARPTLEAIEIRDEGSQSLMAMLVANPRLSLLVQWAEKREIIPQELDTLSLHATNPSFQPLKSAPQDVVDCIWSRILAFAMSVPEAESSSMAFLRAHTTITYSEWILRHKRLRYLLVSKMFCRLALPFLYRTLEFQSEHDLHGFCERLTSTPTLGTNVHEMKLPGFSYIFERDDGYTPVDMSHVLIHTPRLTRLLGEVGWMRHMAPLSWDALVTLGQTAGSNVEEISGLEFKPPILGVSSYSPRIFERFTGLKAFTWSCGYQRNNKIPFFIETEPVSRTALPALEFLRLASSVGLFVFTAMDLPNLRRLEIADRFDLDDDAGPDFLQKHGLKLERLTMGEEITFPGQSVLRWCPRMSVLACEVQQEGGDHFDFAAFAAGFQHTALKTLIINKQPLSNKVKDEKAWKTFFDSLDFNHLPSLREIRVSNFETWPTTEHAISKSMWVKLAEKLSPHEVHLTGRNGVRWHPRLKTSQVKQEKRK